MLERSAAPTIEPPRWTGAWVTPACSVVETVLPWLPLEELPGRDPPGSDEVCQEFLVDLPSQRVSLGVLDTDVASALLRRRASAPLLRILDGSIPAVTFVTIGELTKWTPVRQAL